MKQIAGLGYPGFARHSRCVFLGLALLFADAPAIIRESPAQSEANRTGDVRASITRHLDLPYSMPLYRSAEDWNTRKEALRTQILVSAGLWPTPEKCPLNTQIFGKLERQGYSIEKVYFESYPGFYVTGNLYRPLMRSAPFPAVLTPHGHWAYGRLQHTDACSVPARCINLARQGYVVFSYDMIGYNDSRQVDHRFMTERAALWGLGSLGLHLWNSIRSVDFLESLPDVDKARLACTGESGGGTQTFLLAAVDERIAYAAPVNMVSAHMQGGDVCENAPNLRVDTNNMEIAALIAPRPMILVSATGDWTKNTLEVEFPAIQKIYRLLGAEDRLAAVRVHAEHNYNKESREHVYRWFGKWLLGKTDADSLKELEVSPDRPADVLVHYGRPFPSQAKSGEQITEAFIAACAAAIEKQRPATAAEWDRYSRAFGTSLRYSLMAEYPKYSDVFAFGVQPARQPDFRVVRFFLTRSGKGDRIPATLWLPAGKIPVRQAVLLIHPEGAGFFEQSGRPSRLIAALLKEGCSVLIPDTFNTGRAGFIREVGKKFFTTYNRTDDANRVQDILTSIAYLHAQAGNLPLKVAGLERAGLWSILARAMAEDEISLAADLAQFDPTSDEAFLKTLNIPGIRRAGDFRTASIVNLRGALWIQNTAPSFPSDWILDVYRLLGKAGLLRIDKHPASEDGLLDWLLQGLRRTKP